MEIPILSRVTSGLQDLWNQKNPRYDSYYGMNKQISYEKKIVNNRIEEYEVFQIINKRDSLFNLIKRTFNFY